MSKKVKADRTAAEIWLENLPGVESRRPAFVGSTTTLPLLNGGKVVVWRRKDDIWGNYEGEDRGDYEKALEGIDHYYGKEVAEALAKVVGVVRIELYNAAGCGVVILWNREAWS